MIAALVIIGVFALAVVLTGAYQLLKMGSK
jgi:hypothetical protein